MKVFYINSEGDIDSLEIIDDMPILKVNYYSDRDTNFVAHNPDITLNVDILTVHHVHETFTLRINKLVFERESINIASRTPMEAIHILKYILEGYNDKLTKQLGISAFTMYEWRESVRRNGVRNIGGNKFLPL